MECRYTYTAGENGRALAADRRLKLTRSIFVSIFFWVTLNYFIDDPDSDYSWTLIWTAVVLITFCLTPLGKLPNYLAFRRNVHFNQPMVYVLEGDGFTLQTPLMGQSASWATIGQAGETDTGFLLYWGKSRNQFIWLPKAGFVSQDEIITCRNLILMKVRRFKQIATRRSLASRAIRRTGKRKIS